MRGIVRRTIRQDVQRNVLAAGIAAPGARLGLGATTAGRGAARLRIEGGRAERVPGRHLGGRRADEVHRSCRVPAGQDVGLRRPGRVGGGRVQRRVPAGHTGRRGGGRLPAPASAAAGDAVRAGGDVGGFDPGKGFLVGRGSAGELSISGYALVRYVNQMPGEQTFTDHLGNERTVDGRNDIWPHRVMVFLKGWLGTPEADLHGHTVDRARHQPECHLRQSSGTSSAGNSASTPASTGIPGAARSRARIHSGWATIA